MDSKRECREPQRRSAQAPTGDNTMAWRGVSSGWASSRWTSDSPMTDLPQDQGGQALCPI